MSLTSLQSIRLFCIDVDGTLYVDSKVVDGATELINRISALKKHVIYLTNNSTLSAEQYASKIQAYGLPCSPDQVLCTSAVTTNYLLSKYPEKSDVLVLGQDGLIDTISAKFTVTPAFNGSYAQLHSKLETNFHKNTTYKAVVVGLSRDCTFPQLAHVSAVLEDPNVEFIVTNEDATFPCCNSATIPGSGAITSFLRSSTGRTPTVIGKPEPRMIRSAMERYGTTKEEVVMIGDRLDTDILAGKNAGVLSVLTSEYGIHGKCDVRRLGIEPDLVVDTVKDLVNLI
ncbi:hypothetical protein P9112_006764 [Eukaryota sp. TZLM1-RC]